MAPKDISPVKISPQICGFPARRLKDSQPELAVGVEKGGQICLMCLRVDLKKN